MEVRPDVPFIEHIAATDLDRSDRLGDKSVPKAQHIV